MTYPEKFFLASFVVVGFFFFFYRHHGRLVGFRIIYVNYFYHFEIKQRGIFLFFNGWKPFVKIDEVVNKVLKFVAISIVNLFFFYILSNRGR